MKKSKKDDIADSLRCDSVLEQRTHLLYRNLADRVDLPFIKSILLHIAYDSQKHSAILEGISDSIGGSGIKLKDCGKKLGISWKVIDDISRETANEKNVRVETLPSLAKKLSLLENDMSEEYHILVHMKTLKYMTKLIRESYNVDFEDLKDVFETIIRDEETHLELLAKMKKFMAGQQLKKTETAPAFKYENPDAWRKPLPDSVYEDAL